MASEYDKQSERPQAEHVLILVLVEDGFRDGRFHLPTLLAAMS